MNTLYTQLNKDGAWNRILCLTRRPSAERRSPPASHGVASTGLLPLAVAFQRPRGKTPEGSLGFVRERCQTPVRLQRAWKLHLRSMPQVPKPAEISDWACAIFLSVYLFFYFYYYYYYFTLCFHFIFLLSNFLISCQFYLFCYLFIIVFLYFSKLWFFISFFLFLFV